MLLGPKVLRFLARAINWSNHRSKIKKCPLISKALNCKCHFFQCNIGTPHCAQYVFFGWISLLFCNCTFRFMQRLISAKARQIFSKAVQFFWKVNHDTREKFRFSTQCVTLYSFRGRTTREAKTVSRKNAKNLHVILAAVLTWKRLSRLPCGIFAGFQPFLPSK